jgi:hypothetical protein
MFVDNQKFYHMVIDDMIVGVERITKISHMNVNTHVHV